MSQPNAEYYASVGGQKILSAELSANPEDLGDAIAACEVQLERLKLKKNSVGVMVWIVGRGYRHWDDLDLAGFRALAKFLKECSP